MANKKKKEKAYYSTTGTKPSDWGVDVNAPFESHGPSTPVKSLLKKAKNLKGQRKGYNV